MDRRLLAVADFERDETAGDESGEGLRDEATIDAEPVVSGKKSEGRFVIADFYGKRVAVGCGDVGRVRDDDFETLFGDGGEKVAFKEADVNTQCVFAFSSATERCEHRRCRWR